MEFESSTYIIIGQYLKNYIILITIIFKSLMPLYFLNLLSLTFILFKVHNVKKKSKTIRSNFDLDTPYCYIFNKNHLLNNLNHKEKKDGSHLKN